MIPEFLKKYPNISYWTSIVSFAIGFAYIVAFSGGNVFSNETGILYNLSTNIYTDSTDFNKTRLVFRSPDSIHNYLLESDCNIHAELIDYENRNYLFEIKFLDNLCETNKIAFIHRETRETFEQDFNILSEFDIYEKLLDYPSDRLIKLQTAIEKRIQKTYIKPQGENNYKLLQRQRKREELGYHLFLVKDILKKREEKYILPIIGEELSHDYSRLPNAARPYRSSYTDGIHHGWDIGSKFGQEVVALDQGIIVRIVSGFEFSDLARIKKGADLSYDDRLQNLDILRGNQVWLKTMKGDIVMYSHLDTIASSIQEGVVVHPGQRLGTVGVSGVPEKGYTDYHLHFTIHKNPYSMLEARKYSFLDYMKWDWYFKGESTAEVLKKQDLLFESSHKVTQKYQHENEG